MDIGNTSAATALTAVLLGLAITGPGTGLDAAGVARKARIGHAARAARTGIADAARRGVYAAPVVKPLVRSPPCQSSTPTCR